MRAFSAFECATFALGGLGAGMLLALGGLWFLGHSALASSPLLWVGLPLVLVHTLLALPRARYHTDDEGRPLGLVVSYRAARPLAETIRRHPWALWAYRLGAVAAGIGRAVALAGMLAFVFGGRAAE